MNKKTNRNADIVNPNKGTKGTNSTYDKNQGNRGKQLNPNQQQTSKKEL
jgi:hypothetical protein